MNSIGNVVREVIDAGKDRFIEYIDDARYWKEYESQEKKVLSFEELKRICWFLDLTPRQKIYADSDLLERSYEVLHHLEDYCKRDIAVIYQALPPRMYLAMSEDKTKLMRIANRKAKRAVKHYYFVEWIKTPAAKEFVRDYFRD